MAACSSDPAIQKRPATSSLGAAERPSKRRRLGQASVLCMRELFRAAVKDGNITDENRLVLQNVATLLSQVDGNTWVNFVDTEGSVRELSPQLLKRLRPFLENVVRDLREQEVQLSSLDANNEEILDCLKLADVPWADGITVPELLSVCEPEKDLIFLPGLLKKVTAALPSQYMFRSRVRELMNYYYLKTYTAEPRPSLLQQLEARRVPGISILAPCLRRCLSAGRRAALLASRIAAAPARRCCFTLLRPFYLASTVVASTVAATAAMTLAAIQPRIARLVPTYLHRSREPFWPAVRFFFAAFLHTQTKKIFKVLVLITSWRVVLCLAACNEFCGWLFHPVVWIAERVLNWNKFSRVWGCSCFDSRNPSLLSWIPVRISDVCVFLLKSVRLIPFIGASLESLIRIIDLIHPVLTVLCDLTFSVGIAKGLGMMVDLADEKAQQRLVWMSMSIARMIREGPSKEDSPSETTSGNSPDHGPAGIVGAARAPALDEPLRGPSEDATTLPSWNEEGTWSLFDTE